MIQNTIAFRNRGNAACFRCFIYVLDMKLHQGHFMIETGAETYLFDLMKVNSVTSNVHQPQLSEANKTIRLIKSSPYTGKAQIHSSGMQQFQNNVQR